jgi:hypothetical protein
VQGLAYLAHGADALFTGRAQELAALALRHRMPAIYQYPEFAAAGGLMSYGGSIRDTFHQVGVYVGRILKGRLQSDVRRTANLCGAQPITELAPDSAHYA